jgi:hypothetical protein
MDESGLVTILKERLSKLTYEILDEDLVANDTVYKRYNSVNINWVASPPERVRWIDSNGVENLAAPADYTVTLAGGYITFTTAKTNSDVVRVDYSFFPFSDAQLLSIVQSARKQIQVLIFRPVDATVIPEGYQEAVLKRCYTIALREMQFPTIKYFTISVGGRSMSKENQLVMINGLIESNEKDLLQEVNALRYFDRTNVLQ